VSLAAFASAVAFGAAQRQAVSTSATSAELNTALSAIKTELSSASLGFFVGGVSRCASWNIVTGGTVQNEQPFLPLSIVRDTSTGADRINFVSSSDVKAAASVKLAAAATPDAAGVQLRGWLATQAGEMVLIAPRDPATACTVRQVSGTVDAVPGGAPFTLQLADAAFASSASYVPGDEVSALGRLEQRSVGVDSAQQLVISGAGLAAPVVLLESVMAWRVQYGVAQAGQSGIAWVDPVGAWAVPTSDSLRQVRALRLGAVARSPQRDKQCDATTTLPVLFGAPVDVSAADPDGWTCFRYRRAEVVVPLRNMAWGH
jgi:hypothetical protein